MGRFHTSENLPHIRDHGMTLKVAAGSFIAAAEGDAIHPGHGSACWLAIRSSSIGQATAQVQLSP